MWGIAIIVGAMVLTVGKAQIGALPWVAGMVVLMALADAGQVAMARVFTDAYNRFMAKLPLNGGNAMKAEEWLVLPPPTLSLRQAGQVFGALGSFSVWPFYGALLALVVAFHVQTSQPGNGSARLLPSAATKSAGCSAGGGCGTSGGCGSGGCGASSGKGCGCGSGAKAASGRVGDVESGRGGESARVLPSAATKTMPQSATKAMPQSASGAGQPVKSLSTSNSQLSTPQQSAPGSIGTQPLIPIPQPANRAGQFPNPGLRPLTPGTQPSQGLPRPAINGLPPQPGVRIPAAPPVPPAQPESSPAPSK